MVCELTVIDRDKLGASTSAEDAPDAGKLTSNEAAHLIRDDTFEAPSVRSISLVPVIIRPSVTGPLRY
jgi:hypothetical protein